VSPLGHCDPAMTINPPAESGVILLRPKSACSGHRRDVV
jgi:hypothetical protein